MPRRSPLALLLLLVLLVVPAAAGAQTKPPSAKRQVGLAFKQLGHDTRAVPRKAIKRKHKRALLRIVKRAKKTSIRRPCRTIKTMRVYRRGLKRIHEPGVRRFEPSGTTIRGLLESGALRVNVTLLQLPKAKACGGGKRPAVSQTAPRVLESDERHVRLRVALPSPTFVSHNVGGTEYQQVFMQGMGEGGDVGDPGLPATTQFYGVPDGASVEVKVNATEGYDLEGVNVFPHQEEALDLPQQPAGALDPETFADPPFEKDGKAYRSRGNFPAKPSSGGGVGTMRGLPVGGVDFAGAQFKPKSKKLHVFTSVDVTVEFGGGNKGTFGRGSDLGSKWNTWYQRNLGLLNNLPTVASKLDKTFPTKVCGEEMLVITSPANEAAAKTFASAKLAQGYATVVKLTGSGAGQVGTTNEQIQSYIRGELHADCALRPQYVVLLGNTDAVPTFTLPCAAGADITKCDVATDLPYSLDGDGPDLFADVMLGRIPATDPANAMAVVNKIIGYETTRPAPAGDDFYKHATVTGYWQPSMPCYLKKGEKGTPNCDEKNGKVTGERRIDYTKHREVRGFTQTSDRVLRAMKGDGYAVDRLWTTDNRKVRPEEYQDGTDIPNELRRPKFAWDADTEDFLNSYNAGRSIIMHRDHGWIDGWSAPNLSSVNVPQLTNGTKLPVIFGINCESGRFDIPGNPSFVEEQVEKTDGGGAVAGFGDTRVSPSNPNNHMALGFFDALFPAVDPGFGNADPSRRLGDVLLSGKAYMASQIGFKGQNAFDTEYEHYLYHLLGDPSMQLWAAPPARFDPVKIATKFSEIPHPNPGDPEFKIDVSFEAGSAEKTPAGTVATLFHGDDAIGRGIVGPDGKLTIVPDAVTDRNNLTVSFQQDGTLPARDAVDAQATTLTLQAPAEVKFGSPSTFTGHLDPGFAGATVKIVYTSQKTGEKIERTATTDAGGNYSDTVTFTRPQAGDWRAQATYAGDAAHTGSTSNEVQFTVVP